MKTVVYRRPDNRKTVPAFVLSENEALTLLYVPCSFQAEPDFILIAHDDDCDGVYEDAEANWFSVGSKERLEIVVNLKSVGSKLKGSI
jgi:hypothetical protein